ncbi:hypothetical protein Srufu_009580 [Streptomyces libani subsp. rufus]|nr:hypothetical protein Srufu_009580 [Streptomyces libani subsp. rufus]
MGVDAAEAEGVDARAQRCPSGVPGLGLGDRTHPGPRQALVRFVQMQGRRQRAVVDGECRLDQSGDPGGLHGVAEHRLHRAQADRRDAGAGQAEHPGQGVEFDTVADRGPGAVGLQQAERGGVCGVQPGTGPGLLQRADLAFRPRAHQTGGAPVPRHSRPADDRVHPVAVALGVGQAFEEDDTGAFGQQGAVGPAVEGTDVLGGAERPQLGEDAPQRGDMAVVHGSGDHEVAAAGGQQIGGLCHGQQGGGAGRVEGVGGAAEVQPVGGAGGGEAGDQADGGLGLFGAEARLEGLPYRSDSRLT